MILFFPDYNILYNDLYKIPATSKRHFFARFCQTAKIFDDLQKNDLDGWCRYGVDPYFLYIDHDRIYVRSILTSFVKY